MNLRRLKPVKSRRGGRVSERQRNRSATSVNYGDFVFDLGDSNARALARGDSDRCQIQKIGRNDPCSCGSGKKSKKCCQEN